MIARTFVPSSSMTSIKSPMRGCSRFANTLARRRFSCPLRLSMMTHVVKGGTFVGIPDAVSGWALNFHREAARKHERPLFRKYQRYRFKS